MKRYFILIVAAIAALGLQSCKDEIGKWTERIPIFKVVGPEGEDVLDFEYAGRPQQIDFTVYASDLWSAEVTGCDKYSLNKTVGGVGKTIVTLNAPENEDGAIREAKVSFFFKDELKKQFNITQLIQEPYIEVSPDEKSVSGFGQEFSVEVLTNQSSWEIASDPALPSWLTIVTQDASTITFKAAVNETGASREASLTFIVPDNEDLYSFLTISQPEKATVPTDLILDVVFNTDGTATDASASNMVVKNDRLDGDCKVVRVDKFNLNAAQFNNESIGRTSMQTGYYYIPYDSAFEAKIANGFSYELVFCTYYDPLTHFKSGTTTPTQVKPFASTNAGGVGVCLQAGTGLIQLETHVGTGWKSPKSSVVPQARIYYHVVGTWDNSSSKIYVNGKYENSVNASGTFNFPTINAGLQRFFGIGADPSQAGLGEASFCGEVVVARLYDAPMTEGQVMACYLDLFNE